MKLTWPAPERNKEPIRELLAQVLPPRGRLLELASGSGQHAVYFAAAFPGLVYQPSDPDAAHVASIAAYVAEAGLPNLLPPLTLDVCADAWDVAPVDAVFNANMVHIAPWEAAQGLMRGVGRVLRQGGVLALYGPFKLGGEHTAESNARFDADLRARDPRWGVRDAEAVEALAEAEGLRPTARTAMPANNFVLTFEKR
jgi:SAM-dependent methyltransferase